MRYLFALCVVASLFAVPSLTAEQSPYPFDVGDTIDLAFEALRQPQRCKVLGIKGQFVQCERSGKVEWWNLNQTVFVEMKR